MRLHELIFERREEIIRRWRDRVLGLQTPHSTQRAQLIDSLPVFLDELAAALAAAAGEATSSPLPERSPTAQLHGSQRFHAGFAIDSMVEEYAVLRDVILELVQERGVAMTLDDVRLFMRLMSTGVAEAVRRYSKERDQQLRQKSNEHFAFLAHELRNPLQSAKLALGMLRRASANDRAVETLQRSLLRVSDQIDGALAIARAEAALAGDVPLGLARTQLAVLLADAVHETALDAEHKHIRLSLECAQSVLVDADPRLLRSAVTNLIRNAVKFTHDGGAVIVRCRTDEDHLSIEVEDQCGGLPEGVLETLFSPFVQAGRDRSGFGLGLSIARQAVEAHGGTLQARDLPGQGCVFLISLRAPK